VMLFLPFTGAEPTRRPPDDRFVYNLRASYHQEVEGLVDHFVQIGRKRIAIFYQIDAYGRTCWEGARDALAKHGLRLVEEATYKRGTAFEQSMLPQVEILRKANPDAIIAVGTYGACAALIHDARDQGLDVPIANVSFVSSDNLLGQLQKVGKQRNKDYTRNLINSQVVPCFDEETLPAVREYRLAMERNKPQPPEEFRETDFEPLPYGFVSFEGYLNAKLLVAILRKAESLDRASVRKAADSLKDFSLGLGEDTLITFTPTDHLGLNKVFFTTVREGRFVSMKDEDWKEWQR
jgi:branched-chain amino acid transport system substrate-binding protein